MHGEPNKQPSRSRAERAPRAIVGVSWLVLAVLAPWHVAGEARSGAVAVVLIVWGWLGWTAVTVGLLVPIPVSLTVARCVMPLAVAVAVAARSPWSVAVSIVCLVASMSPALADEMVQGGAYGRETRFALRTPVPQLVPAIVAWLVLVVAVIGGSLATAAGAFAPGIPLLAVGAALLTRTPRLLHRLSRRWLVIVPAGIVVHDHMVLAETMMVRTSSVTGVALLESPDESADLTGGVTGQRVRISMREADKVVLSPIAAKTLGTTEALHVLSFAVAPRRARAAVAALASLR